MNKYVELPKEHITFYGDTEEEKKKNEIIFDLSLEVDRLNKAINEIKEKIDDYFAYDYENESQARLDTINEINHIIVDLQGEDKDE